MFIVKIVKPKKARNKKRIIFFVYRNGKQICHLGEVITPKDKLHILKFKFSRFFRFLLRTDMKITKRIHFAIGRALLLLRD
jgi:hypothetical protein